MADRRIILCPLDRPGGGSGHMRRCYELARKWRDSEAGNILLITERPLLWRREISGFPDTITLADRASLLETINHDSPGGDLLIIDQRQTTIEEIRQLSEAGLPVLLDDDGTARQYAPFVLDAIPGPRFTEANIRSAQFLDLPKTARKPDPEGDILLSFGGQDPRGLGEPVLDCLIEEIGVDSTRIATTRGTGASSVRRVSNDSADNFGNRFNIRVVDAAAGLKEHLADFGLVICTYGLTALEAVSVGCAVICIDPSPYHAKLSKKMGLPGVGYATPRKGRLPVRLRRRLAKLFSRPESLIDSWAEVYERIYSDDLPEDIPDSIEELIPKLSRPAAKCAACDAELPPVIARFPYRSYYRCQSCSIIGLYRFKNKIDHYESEYFDQEYRDQYGRSYLEDFPAIKKMGHSRLKIIKRYQDSGRLLDIGCAYGPFLEAAAASGFSVFGTDVSEAAVNYVTGTLRYPASIARFPEFDSDMFGAEKFDVVSLWYVIEHFTRLSPIFQKMSEILNDRGVLAFSTPNARGISGLKSLRTFLYQSPDDHYTVWSPRIARVILRHFGFRIRRIRITGHHPERIFPGLKKGSFLFKVFEIISRFLGLGDTFEVYAEKSSRSRT